MQSWTIGANVGTGLVQIFVWFEKLSLTYHCNSNSTITANHGEENRGGAMIHFLGLMLLAQQRFDGVYVVKTHASGSSVHEQWPLSFCF